jgi:hypothetical protein
VIRTRRWGPLPLALLLTWGCTLGSCFAGGTDPDRTPPQDAGGDDATTADGGPVDPPDAQADAGTPPRLEVGAGETAFVPLDDGDDLVLHMGFQGGWHVFPGARGYRMDPDGMVLSYALRDPDTGEPETFPRQITLSEDRVLWGDGYWDRFGDALIITGLDTDVLGRTLELVARLADPDRETVLEDVRSVVIVAP